MYQIAGRTAVVFVVTGMFCVLIFGLVFSALDTGPNGGPFSSQTAAWAAAIGTYVAFGGTLWVATDQKRARKQERWELATLTAERLHPRVILLSSALRDLQTSINSSDDMAAFFQYFPIYIKHFESIEFWSDAELIALMPLPRNCARKLAAINTEAKSLTHLLKQEVVAYEQACDRTKVTKLPAIFKNRLNSLTENVKSAGDTLRDAKGRLADFFAR